MSLDLGTLRGFLELDDAPFNDALDSAEEKLSGFGGKGAKIAATAGAAIAAAIGGSIVAGMNVEAANDKLAAQLSLTEGESARIGKIAGQLYASNYGESLEGVNDAIRFVVQNIDGMRTASAADLTEVSKDVLNLATTFEQDLGMTTAAVGQMMRTGMAKDAKEALDIITVGLQGPANKADDLMETFNEYGTQFRKLGLSGQGALGLLTQGMQAGARDADIVADSIKEFSIRSMEALQTLDSKGQAVLTPLGQAFVNLGLDGERMQTKIANGGPGATKALDQVLDRLRGIKDPVDRSATAVALFGTQAEDMGEALYALDPSKAVDSLGKVEGAAKDLDTTLSGNAKASLESFKRQAQLAFVGLADWALPAVNDMTAALAEKFGPALANIVRIGGDVVDFIGRHQTAAKILVGVLVALVAITKLHGAVLAVQAAGGLMKYLTTTRLVSSVTKAWAAVQWLLNAALSANPIGLVVIGIALLVAALIVAYKKSETFRDIVSAGLKLVGGYFTFLWNYAARPALLALGIALGVTMKLWAAMLTALGKVPGFGWAAEAGKKMGAAADKAMNLGDTIKKIPEKKDSKISVDTGDARTKVLELSRLMDDQLQRRRTVAIRGGAGLNVQGAKAGGGPVQAGKTYTTGEQGMELFTPNVSGRILSNRDLAAALVGGGRRGTSHTWNITEAVSASDTAEQVSRRQMMEEV